MNTIQLILPTLLLSLLAGNGAAPAQQEQSRADRLFPVASEGMTFPGIWTNNEVSSWRELLEQVADRTEWNLNLTGEANTVLANSYPSLLRPVDVPAEELVSLTCALLRSDRFVLTVVREAEPVLFRIRSADSQAGRDARREALFVEERELEDFARYPALLVTTTVELPHTDVRSLSNSLRGFVPDPNTMSVIPVADARSLILVGFPDHLLTLTQILKKVDERTARRQAETPAGGEAPDREE